MDDECFSTLQSFNGWKVIRLKIVIVGSQKNYLKQMNNNGCVSCQPDEYVQDEIDYWLIFSINLIMVIKTS